MKKVMLMVAAVIMCGIVNLKAQQTYTDIGFNDIADVFAEVKSNVILGLISAKACAMMAGEGMRFR